MFTWSEEHQAPLISGAYLLNNPDTNTKWSNVDECRQWWELSQHNPDNAPAAAVPTLEDKKAEKFALIKVKAAQLIGEIEGADQWALRKAEQRAELNTDVTERNRLYAQIEHVRQASNQAEIDLAALNTIEAVSAFEFIPPAFTWGQVHFTPIGFTDLFDDVEISRFYAAMAPLVKSLQAKLMAAAYIDLTHADTTAALKLMKDELILTAGRHAAINERISGLVDSWRL